MAAIAEISTLQEWDEEWRTVEDDLLKFKTGQFLEYQKKMDEFHKSQKSCLSMVNLMKRKINDFDKALKRLEKQNDTPESKKLVVELRYRIELLENKIKEVQRSLPSSAGSFLRLCLGDINVSLYNKKLEYKDNYEKFKLKMTILCTVFACFNLVCNYRLTDSLFHGVLVWYYSTLTLQEHILIANGSRIKGWWVLHHYFSILLSGFLLIWPDGIIYQMFRRQFFLFSLYLSFVQLIQFKYQSGVMYRLRALGVSHGMDVTVDGFQTWMWRGLGFVLPFLFLGYVFQFYNAYTLVALYYHPDCREWQVMATGVTFFVLFFGNFTTLLYVLKQKMTKGQKMRVPCG
ncbi:transmembrane protein 120A-like [Actinia tenebrosa]|uniref:Transmembrane protein 120A-like n=1 Tax=Actinia tenebrosa TaxID=6105 RepID=A0A6P8HAC7_ACTTE|nr:transmembrane protein 120A-like [Actinia tenebrosa]